MEDSPYGLPPGAADEDLDADLLRERMYVSSPNGQSHIFGMYVLVEGELANGMPMWRQLGGERWLYSDNHGRWTIGGAKARNVNFQNSSGFVYCSAKHQGSLPDEVSIGKWMRHDEETGKWCLDEEITVSNEFQCPEIYDGRRGRNRGRGRGKEAKGRGKGKDGAGRGRGAAPTKKKQGGMTRNARDLYFTPRQREEPPPEQPQQAQPTQQPQRAEPRSRQQQQQQEQQRAQQEGGGRRQRRPAAKERVEKHWTRAKALRTLGVTTSPGEPPLTPKDLRRAYRRAAMRSHPDRRQNHGREEDAKRRFQDVRDAFEFLQSGGAPMMSDMF